MQKARGERDGAIVWALSLHGDELQSKLRGVYRLDSDDLYQEIVATLCSTPYAQTQEMLESGDIKRLWGWFSKLASQRLSENHNRSRQDSFEREISTTTDDQFTDLLTTPGDAEPLAAIIDPCTIAALKLIDDPQVVQAMTLNSFGYSWSEIAPLTGYSSKQAVQRACTSPARKEKIRLAWRALHGDEICPEIATDLSHVAWALEDLDPETKARVDAHLELCPSCEQILTTHEATKARAAAFLPMPALALAQHDSMLAHLHAMTDWVAAKFHNTIATVSGQSANGSWNAPKTGAALAAGALLVGGGGAAVHKAATDSDSESKNTATSTAKPTAFYDRIDVPPVTREKKHAKKKNKKKKQATTVAPAPAPIPAQPSTQQSNSSPKPVEDGSSEFLPEER